MDQSTSTKATTSEDKVSSIAKDKGLAIIVDICSGDNEYRIFLQNFLEPISSTKSVDILIPIFLTSEISGNMSGPLTSFDFHDISEMGVSQEEGDGSSKDRNPHTLAENLEDVISKLRRDYFTEQDATSLNLVVLTPGGWIDPILVREIVSVLVTSSTRGRTRALESSSPAKAHFIFFNHESSDFESRATALQLCLDPVYYGGANSFDTNNIAELVTSEDYTSGNIVDWLSSHFSTQDSRPPKVSASANDNITTEPQSRVTKHGHTESAHKVPGGYIDTFSTYRLPLRILQTYLQGLFGDSLGGRPIDINPRAGQYIFVLPRRLTTDEKNYVFDNLRY
ncbi:hypothetical protein F4821DRAFT_58906 [Hypoxylon rubiginosum]|uniref:Uncharacterized protein n=1 Tax=Hypoxylon rubiginosum TaxID=110542 RepID=A0ACC0CJE2_9PEZI|nr:hypothetical protein F4821DRAFT_58906 [Hypoxylon rubiginosum]